MRKYIYITQRRQRPQQRRGATAIIAMLYLVLFSSLAVGFVAATQTAVQVAYNEDSAQRALLAAESGMDFIRYHLYAMTIDRKTPKEQLLQATFAQLATMMDGSPNLGGGTISLVNGAIRIPGDQTKFVSINDAGGVAKFRAVIEMNPDDVAEKELRVWVSGYHKQSAGSTRGVRLDYKIQDKVSEILKYGVAAKGPIIMRSNAHISGVSGEAMFGSVLTTTTSNPAMSMAGSASVSGEIAITDPTNRLSYSSNSKVGDYSAGSPEGQALVHIGVEAPDFPFVDTSVFEPFATNVISGGNQSGTFTNIRIPANSNPSFSNGAVLNGVIYVEAPNRISFGSNTKITGAIVVQNDPSGNLSTNTISFASNLTLNGVDSLVGSQWDSLRKLAGCAILAPNFNVTVNSNFGSVGGMIVAGQITMDSNASGTVVGGFMSLTNNAPVTFSSNSNILVKTRIASNTPAGLYFDKNYAPKEQSYQEFVP